MVLGARGEEQQTTESNLQRFQILGLTETDYKINMFNIFKEIKKDLKI